MNKNGILSVVIVIAAVVLIGLWVLRTGQQRAGSRQFDCAAAPTAPAQLVVDKLPENAVKASWQASTGAEMPTSYVMEAGSGPGKNDVGTFIMPATATTTERPGAPGTFYARVYARNACGTSGPSNEVVVTLP
ncbi:MAG: fibronectin type III domain-containing protein [Acidobacteriota bacterium]